MSFPFPIAADIAVEPRSITPLQRLSLYENILQVQPDHLGPGHCLLAWTYLLLLELPWLPPEAVNLIIRRSREHLLAEGERIEQKMEPPIFTLVFVERNFCTWTGATGYVDLRDGTVAKQLPVTAVESIAYNLMELYRRNRARCKDATHNNAARQQRGMGES
jgi:hypothetical protein